MSSISRSKGGRVLVRAAGSCKVQRSMVSAGSLTPPSFGRVHQCTSGERPFLARKGCHDGGPHAIAQTRLGYLLNFSDGPLPHLFSAQLPWCNGLGNGLHSVRSLAEDRKELGEEQAARRCRPAVCNKQQKDQPQPQSAAVTDVTAACSCPGVACEPAYKGAVIFGVACNIPLQSALES